jgi:FkbM family methyltransferase
MHPEFWLGDIRARTPIGVFACRSGTSDFDLVNPNHEPVQVNAIRDLFERIPTERAVFVDVGAHIGKYSILVGNLLENRGTVVAVEPDPDNFASLKGNIALNHLSNIRPLNVGCWSKDEILNLHRQTRDLGGHSFVDRTRGESIQVTVKTLDRLLAELKVDHVDVMKLDVQRAEAEVLLGARSLLESNQNLTIFLEESGNPRAANSLRLLREFGFDVRQLEDINYVAKRARGGVTGKD